MVARVLLSLGEGGVRSTPDEGLRAKTSFSEPIVDPIAYLPPIRYPDGTEDNPWTSPSSAAASPA